MRMRRAAAVVAAGLVALATLPMSTPLAVAADPVPSPCELSKPLYFGGDATAKPGLKTVWKWRNSTTGAAAGPPVQNVGDYSLRSFARTLTNTTSGNAARELHDVTAYYSATQMAATVNHLNYLQAPWDAQYGAFVTQGEFPAGWEGRVTPPAGSTVEIYDAGAWDGSAYILGTKMTASVPAESVPVPLTGTAAIPYDNTGQRLPVRAVASTLALGQTLTYTTGVSQENPTAPNGSYTIFMVDDFTAKICLPTPTVAGWKATSVDGLGTVTGTGSYPGDDITVTTAAGTVLGTATVNADLTWTLTLTSPLPSGPNPLTATETDASYSTPTQPLRGTSAPAPHPVGTPALSATITDAQGATTSEAPRIVTTADAYPVTFTLTNTGTANVTHVHLAAPSASGLTLTAPVCSPDVTGDAVTLAPGATASCTATLSGLTADAPGTISITADGASPVSESGVSATAGYWVQFRVPQPTPSPTPSPTTTPTPTASPTASPTATPEPGTLPFTGGGQAIGLGAAGLALVALGALGIRRARKA